MVDITRVQEIVDRHGRKRERLIAMLLDCQEEFYHLPRPVIEEISGRVGVPTGSLLAIATFFRAFSLKPVGKHPIRVCTGTACHVQGALRLMEALERKLAIRRGDVTGDELFGLDTVNCLGCCGLAPVVTVGRDVHGKLKQAQVSKVLRKYGFKETRDGEGEDRRP